MSLDLYIISKTPVLHRGTGVYIRENGETKELSTKQEVLTHFPDIDPDTIEEKTYEDDTYFHVNITHNLTDMADKCRVDPYCQCVTIHGEKPTLYDLLWNPNETIGIVIPDMEYVEGLVSCYKKLLEDADYFKKFNPDNGWGTYEQLVKRTKEYINALTSISDNFENYVIEAST